MDRALVLLVSLFLAGCTPLANSAGGAAPTTRMPAPCPVTLAYQLPPDEVIEWSASSSTRALTHEQVVEAARRNSASSRTASDRSPPTRADSALRRHRGSPQGSEA